MYRALFFELKLDEVEALLIDMSVASLQFDHCCGNLTDLLQISVYAKKESGNT